MTNLTKKRIIALLVGLLLSAYIISYFIVRQHRLSAEFVVSGMLFSSEEDALEYMKNFPSERKKCALMYGDSELLYLFYFPVLQVDSIITGRHIASPYGVTPFRVSENSKSVLQPIALDHIESDQEE